MTAIRSLEPNASSVNPELKIRVDVDIDRDREVVLGVFGELSCEDKKIANVYATTENENSRILARFTGHRTHQQTLLLYAPLTRRSLRYIEQQRDEHPHGDVELHLTLHVRRATLTVSEHRELLLRPSADQGADVPSELRGEIVKTTGLRGSEAAAVISPNNSGELLRVENRSTQLRHTISSSDWTQKFCAPLGVGHFLLVEYHMPSVSSPGDDTLSERLGDAMASLDAMQRYIQAGEWALAVQKVRDIAELFRHRDAELRALLERDAVAPEAASEITSSLKNLFDYASKFVHREDRSGDNLLPRMKPSKEDAYLAYTVGTAAVNLIAAKLRRLSEAAAPKGDN